MDERLEAFQARAITCVHIAERGMPVLVVGRFPDGTWDLLCGAELHNDEELLVAHAYHLANHDQSLATLADLPRGSSTERASVGEPWSAFEAEPIYEQARPESQNAT